MKSVSRQKKLWSEYQKSGKMPDRQYIGVVIIWYL